MMTSLRISQVSALVLTVAVCSSPSEAAIIYVNSSAGGGNNGTNWTNAYTLLQTALGVAGSNDEVWVAQGTYTPGAARTSSFTFNMTNTGVEVYGGFRGAPGDEGVRNNTTRPMDFQTGLPTLASILSGDIGTPGVATDNCYHVVSMNTVDPDTILDGFTIRDGFSRGFGGGSTAADRRGAGIHVVGSSSSPRIRNCIIRDNDCTAGNGSGGGLFAEASNLFPGTLAITNCRFMNNRASASGGGAFVNYMSAVDILSCRFESNETVNTTSAIAGVGGGGLYLAGGAIPTVTLVDCAFESNKTADGEGGGLWCGGSLVNARRCDFIDNEAKRQSAPLGQGGGMYAWRNTSTTLIQCRFIRNFAIQKGTYYAGGGLAVSAGGGDHKIINCEFIENSADPEFEGYGGGLLNLGVKGIFEVTNCLFVGNSAHYGGAIHTSKESAPQWPSAEYFNCTIAGNTAINATGGVRVGTEDAALFHNCIFWENTDSTSGGGVTNLQQIGPIGMSGPIVTYSCVAGGVYSGTGNINDDPLFVDPTPADVAIRNYRLQPCSPASDVANDAAVPADSEDVDEDTDTNGPTPDLDLSDRIVDNPYRTGDAVDMGAFELAVPECSLPGDINVDTDIDGVDIQFFVGCTVLGEVTNCECADINLDGAANENDIPCFVDLLLTGTSCGIVDCDIGQRSFSDCNANGVNDKNDIGEGTSPDCNENGTPDECEIDENSTAEGGPWYCESDCADDVNDNGMPDECENDCNTNGIPDSWDIFETTCDDVNTNGVPDECEWDCNTNGIPDAWDISETTSADCNTNGIPDECEDDCNTNGVPDDCDVDITDPDGDEWVSPDCNEDDYPDECNLSLPPPFGSSDCNTNGIPDECDIATCESDPYCDDCNSNGIPDGCDIAAEISEDIDTNGIPDECEGESLMGGGGESMMSSMGGGESEWSEDGAWEAFYDWSIAQCWGLDCQSGTDAQFAAMIDKLRELGLPTAAVGP